LFFDEGGSGGVSPGIAVYADIRVTQPSVGPDQRLSAILYRDQGGGNYSSGEAKHGDLGSQVLRTKFEDVSTAHYKVVVWIADENETAPSGTEVGWTSDRFYYTSSSYESFVLDSDQDWDNDEVEIP
jgi:hypothetical protein